MELGGRRHEIMIKWFYWTGAIYIARRILKIPNSKIYAGVNNKASQVLKGIHNM